jgi:heme exporter protein B
LGIDWSGWARDVWAVAVKEVRSELRTRYALSAILLFAVTSVVMIGFATALADTQPRTQAALFWVVIFFAAMSALSQVFIKEEEAGTSLALKLASRPDAVYMGKLLFNLALLVLLCCVITPLFVTLVDMTVYDWPTFLSVLALAVLGLAGATTTVAAIVAQASSRGALFAVLSFPILLPLLIAAIGGTMAALDPVGAASAAAEFKLLGAYAVAMFTGSWLLFEFVWWA